MAGISTPYYKALDFTLIFFSCSLAYWVRFDTIALPLPYFLPTAIFALFSTTSLSITNFYQEINSESSPKQVVAAFSGLGLSTMLTIACLYFTKTGADYSRIWLTSSVSFTLIGLLLTRTVLKRVFRISTKPRVIILLGGKRTAQIVKNKIDSLPGYEISIDRQFRQVANNNPKSESNLDAIAKYIERRRKDSSFKIPITEIWITYDIYSKFSPSMLSDVFSNSSVSLVYVPELPDFDIADEKQIHMIAGVPTINSSFTSGAKLSQLLKFAEDQCIAWVTLIILSPLFFIIAVCIKLDSQGPVFFKQMRYGLGGKSFLIWKFRTMHASESKSEFKQARKNDPRVTKVGKFLRRSSLDELPQLINVIGGSMSIVGPRPHPEQLNEYYRGDISRYMYRHASKPGITGLAQVKGFRGETANPELMEQRVKYDLEYVRNWSIFLDIKILLMTFMHLIKTNKAH